MADESKTDEDPLQFAVEEDYEEDSDVEDTSDLLDDTDDDEELYGSPSNPRRSNALPDTLPTSSPSSVPLLPFAHQVGGHAPFLRFNPHVVCKQATERERAFYESLQQHAPALLSFTPKYMGVANVSYVKPIHQENTTVAAMQTTTTTDGSDHGEMKSIQRFRATVSSRSEGDLSVVAERDAAKITSEEKDSTNSNNPPIQPMPLPQPQQWTPALFLDQNQHMLQQDLWPGLRRSRRLRATASGQETRRRKSHQQHRRCRSSDDRAATETSNPIENENEKSNVKQEQEKTTLPATTFSRVNPWSMQLLQQQLQPHDQHETKQFLLLQDLTERLVYPCILDLKMGTRQHGVGSSPVKRASQMAKVKKTTSATLGVRVCGMQVYKITTGSFVFQNKYDGRQLTISQFQETLASFLDNGRVRLVWHLAEIVRRLKELQAIVMALPRYRFYSSSLLLLYDGDPALVVQRQATQSPSQSDPTPTASHRTRTRSSRRSDHQRLRDDTVTVRIIDFAHSVCPANYEISRQLEPEESWNPNDVDDGYLRGLQSLIDTFETILS